MLINNNPMEKLQASMLNPLVLAYIGDGVYELLVRDLLVRKTGKNNGRLHSEAIGYVSCKAQSMFVEKIYDKLTDEEIKIYKRGRNSNSMPNKNSDLGEYKRATGLEALFGYLYLIGSCERMNELFETMLSD